MTTDTNPAPAPTSAGEDIRAFLSSTDHALLLDGALATELEARGCDLNDPLWSGKVLLDEPELICAVGDAYLHAGARCLITASYQATPQALQERRGLDAEAAAAAVARSVALAQASRAAFYTAASPTPGPVFIAGSVGPYGAYLADGSEYRGDYVRTEVELQDFHRPRIAALVAAGADLLAVETQPSAAEVRAILALLESEFPRTPCWVSFTLRDPQTVGGGDQGASEGGAEPLRIADGTPIAEVAEAVSRSPSVVAVGVNCIPLRLATRALEEFAKWTTKPLVVYPNSGEVYDARSKTWSPDPRLGLDHSTLAAHATAWRRSGARFIGGCCRTGPRDIEDLAGVVKSWPTPFAGSH